jgi:hypothetical protein
MQLMPHVEDVNYSLPNMSVAAELEEFPGYSEPAVLGETSTGQSLPQNLANMHTRFLHSFQEALKF